VRYLRKPSDEEESEISQDLCVGTRKWREEKFDCEINLLRWLRANTTLPVPEILEDVTSIPDEFPHKLSLMKRLPGTKVFNMLGKCCSAVQVTFSSDLPVWETESKQEKLNERYADAMLETFYLDVPQ
jgi:hypothetical protein